MASKLSNRGPSIIELQEELTYMPMQRLVGLSQDPNGVGKYGSLILMEIENRKSLENSMASQNAPTTTVTEDVISSVTSPAGLPSPDRSTTPQASGGISSIPQPPMEQPMQMFQEGGVVQLQRDEFVIPKDILNNENKYVSSQPPIGYTLPENEINLLERTMEDQEFEDWLQGYEDFREEHNLQDMTEEDRIYMNTLPTEEVTGYAEGGWLGEGGLLNNAFFSYKNPLDYALLVPGLGAAGVGIKGLSSAYKAFKAGKLSKEGLKQIWKNKGKASDWRKHSGKKPEITAKDKRTKSYKDQAKEQKAYEESWWNKPDQNMLQKGIRGAAKRPYMTAGVAYGGGKLLGGGDEENVNAEEYMNLQAGIMPDRGQQLRELRAELGLPSLDTVKQERQGRLMMELGSQIANATDLGEFAAGLPEIAEGQRARQLEDASGNLGLMEYLSKYGGQEAIYDKIDTINDQIKAIEAEGLEGQSMEERQRLLTQLKKERAMLMQMLQGGMGFGQGILQGSSRPSSSLDETFSELDAITTN